MARYIDADAAVEEARLAYCKDCNSYNGVMCRACAFDDAVSFIEDYPAADVVPKSEWTSVEDRLPERKQVVLCYRGDFRGDMMNTYVYLGSGNWEDDYGYRGTSEHEGITHWMPLPEPPKMKGQ